MTPRSLKLHLAVVAIVIFTAGISVRAQQPVAVNERYRLIQLCQQSNYEAAFDGLQEVVRQNKNDPEAWQCLGFAWLARNKKSEARKAFRSSVAGELAIFGLLHVVTSRASPVDRPVNNGRFETAVKSGEKYLELTPNASNDEREEVETIRWYRDFYKGLPMGEEILPRKDITTRLQIVSKPPPDFRGTRTAGTAVLRAVFSGDGTIKHILVIQKVSPEFDHACIQAARHIQFTPALKDGRPVSMILGVEYTRTIF